MGLDHTTSGPARLQIVAMVGDVTLEPVDVVVNAANPSLSGGGGVDGAIHRAAGPARLQQACRALHGCAVGDAKLTEGFDLPARWIAHAVGPVWRGGGFREREALSSCYRRCLELAEEVDARTIAFPAISTGVYGFPKPEAARIAVTTLCATTTTVELAKLVAFDRATYDLYEELLSP